MTSPCGVCEQTAFIKFKGHIGYQNTDKYDIYHCANCETAFASPLKIDPQIYNLIYSKGREIEGYNRYYKYAEGVLQSKSPLDYLAESEDIYWSVREYLKSKKSKKIKILEVGSGLGYLTYALVKSGFDVKGIDISQVAVQESCKRYGNHFACVDVIQYAKESSGKYDLIIFTELIEHIPEIKPFLKAVNQLLLPGGDLLMTTPNKTPYAHDVLWETEPPPVHLWWFSEKALCHLAKELGHSVTFIDLNPFNIKEVARFGYYTKPSLKVANFKPSRTPRLDENGNIIKYVYEIPKTEITTSRKNVKKVLSFLGLLNPLARFRDTCFKLKLMLSLKLNPQKRPTLSAIFHKAGKT